MTLLRSQMKMLLAFPSLGTGSKMEKTGGAGQAVARLCIQMKGVLPTVSGVIIID